MFFFVPLGTTRPRRNTPWVTYGLMATNLAVFVLQLTYPGSFPQGFVPSQPSFLSWFASVFMHAGIFHLGGNMLFLWLFAGLTEDVFGHWLLLGVYLAGELGAMLLHVVAAALSSPPSLDTPVIGASGAIAGVMGLSAVCFLQARVRVWYLVLFYYRVYSDVVEIAAPLFLGAWAAWEIIQGSLGILFQLDGQTAGGVAHWAHVGGFAAGLGAALALRLRSKVVRTDLVEARLPVLSKYDAYSHAGELERILAKDPNDAEAWYALGRAHEIGGRRERAAQAHSRAVQLFLSQRLMEGAVRAYRALSETGGAATVPEDQRFALASALDERGLKDSAFQVFYELGATGGKCDRSEMALLRAGEIARLLSGYEEKARNCYQRLLDDYPDGHWRGLAQSRLWEMG